MPVGLDSYLGVHADALKVQTRRMDVLANNLANVDTPGYKARDIDFRTALAAASSPDSGVSMRTTDAKDIAVTATGDGGAALKYRVPLAPSLDGNTVDSQQEQAAFAENTVHYQATLTFLSMRLRNLMTAITGQ
ncbi:MAG TPA: flagellar basal body rod protein FlgB [Steroidobacteraceae bacterium]|jgi:flagellar basal-body rod protein FlgB|nr:flagellar basal body rod protein FlgB [Steroidobacteraceae bacterium]